MRKEKQIIEEMAKVIETTEQIARDAHCGLPSPTMYAKDLYWKGYRKQSELTPCDCCRFNPPSSADGKPCLVCPAQMKGGAE